jgi:regulator of protease activity HflC (stomatin/prohibitin superfamily)
MNHAILYRNGKVQKEGRGLSFFYFAPSSSIVSIPLESQDFPFIFQEISRDFQEIYIQGQITFKVRDPRKLAEILDFTVDPKGNYLKEDPEKLEQRIIHEAQTAATGFLRQLSLKEALHNQQATEEHLRIQLQHSEAVQMLGVEILGVNVLSIKPNPEMARALEAQTREALQQEADQAIYERRNFAVEQERKIKESELNTEIAIEEKQKQIAEKLMETDTVKQKNRQKLREMELEADIQLEDQKQRLVDMRIENERKEADAKQYYLNASLQPFKSLDWKTLMAIRSGGSDAQDNIALAFRELAENAGKIGSLNISPDLLDSMIKSQNRS